MMKASHATMDASAVRPDASDGSPLPSRLLGAEERFYRRYPWCLNAFPTLGEIVGHLGQELERLPQLEEDWPRLEVMTNVFLLSCAVADTVDDYLHGDGYDFSKLTSAVPLLGPGVRVLDKILQASQNLRALRARPVRRWRAEWTTALGEFLSVFVAAATADRTALAPAAARLARAARARGAQRGAIAVVVEEPVNTGSTLARAVDAIRGTGFAAGNVVALVPVHPSQRDWTDSHESPARSGTRVLRLEPEQWHKDRLLERATVEGLLGEYFEARGYSSARVVPSEPAQRLNAELQRRSEEKFHTRLKRIYDLRLEDALGRTETRYVLAKSVGWGWLGYHAFFIGARLAQFVPPVLGLRNGILYTEWLPPGRRPAR